MIRNGIDVTHFRPPTIELRTTRRLALGYSSNDFVVGYSAGLRPEKNHAQLIDAIKFLVNRGVNAKALLIGDGPMRKMIESRAQAAGILDRIKITGFVGDVSNYLAAIDVGVICSTSVETLSLSALECLACGVPMVMSDIGGASEIIDVGVNGYLYPAGNTDEFVKALLRCCDDQLREKLGSAGRQTMLLHFDHDEMVAQYITLFENISRNNSAPS